MKSARNLLTIALLLAAAVFAQSQAQKPAGASSADSEKAFAALKTLGGSWEGRVTIVPPMPGEDENNQTVHVALRVTSRGNAIVHEMQQAGTALDPDKYDHPITMLYLDSGRLTLVHYCDAGNRPRMVGKLSPDGKKIEFSFVDLAGPNDYGHMYHAVFTFIDANHHLEDWTYMMPGDKPIHARLDLTRTKTFTLPGQLALAQSH